MHHNLWRIFRRQAPVLALPGKKKSSNVEMSK
jgi:hypothetical protein